MFILRIEHKVANFDGWKKAFDSDPIGRQKMGVRRYRISTGLDDANNVLIDLEFETSGEAQDLLKSMEGIWKQIQGKLIFGPRSQISEIVETIEL